MRYLALILLAVALMGGECNQYDGSNENPNALVQQGESPVAPIPEPSGALLFATGIVLVGAARHQAKRRRIERLRAEIGSGHWGAPGSGR